MTIVVLMGVAGAGKTTVGKLVADALGWRFIEGDDFHPPSNVGKLRKAMALTDEDRAPWLAAIGQAIRELESRGESAVIACSALRRSYRDVLRAAGRSVQFVYLKGDMALIRQRLQERKGHFAAPSLLDSQFDVLEEPSDAFVVDIAAAPQKIAARIAAHLGVAPH